jgi:hypothetical protein
MRLLLVLTLVAAVLLTACGTAQPTPAQIPTAQPTSAPSVPPTEPPVEPAEPVTQPTEPSAQPTEPLPEPTQAPEPTPLPIPVAEGRVSFRDNLSVADQLVLTMRGINPPPDGTAYEGWLIADDGVTEISTGVFEVGADGSVDYTWTSPTGENLVAGYASFAVTVEPGSDSDPGPSNEIAFRGAAASDILGAARRVFAVNDGEPVTPRNVSYGQGLLGQSQVARDHIINAFNAAAIGAHGEMRTHNEHVINIIEGAAGSRFVDYTGDGRAENPGDGFGALVYARQIATLLPTVSDEFEAIETLLVAIQDKAEEILGAPDVASAQPALNEFKALSEQLDNVAPTFYAAAQAAVGYPIEPTP